MAEQLTEQEMAEEALAAEIFRTDELAHYEAFGSIVLKSGDEQSPPVANFLQLLISAVRAEFRRRGLPCRILTLKPRQKGSTTYSGQNLYHDLRRKRTSGCVIGAQYSQCKNAFDIISHYQAKDTFPWGNDGKVTEEVGRWSNGSKLVMETAGDGEAGRSGTFQFLLVTEAARWAEKGVKDARKVMAGILKCVPPLPDTCVIIETTAAGASGDYYDRWLDAMDAADFLAGAPLQPGSYVRVFAPWFEFHDGAIPLSKKEQLAIEDSLDTEERYRGEKDLLNEFGWRDEAGVMRLGKSCTKTVPGPGGTMLGPFTAWEQLAWRRWSIDDECKKSVDVFNQDYPESWQKAFLMSGRRRFNNHGLKKTREGIKQPTFGVLERQGDDRVVWRTTSAEEAMIYRYEEPKSGRRYLVSADTMTGASQTVGADPDCHGVFVLRQGFFESGRGWVPPAVVARIRPPCRWDIDILEDQVWRLAQHYGGRGGCMIVPEINMDRGMVELLKKRGATIYERQVYNEREQRMTGQLGWQTTKNTREPIIENLAKAIREQGQEGQGFDIRDAHAVGELEHFVVKDTGRSEAEGGHHDDDVLGLAIGLGVIGSATELKEEVLRRRLPSDLERMERRANAATAARVRGYS